MKLKEKLDPKTTALIVIDVQNDFCSPDGVMASLGKDVSSMPELVNMIAVLVEVCEQSGIPVFYTQQIYDRSKLTPLQIEQYDLDGKLVTCDINGVGWKFFDLNPPADKVFQKYNYNIFSNESLVTKLIESKTKTLIITGVSTQICVETAIRNGFDLGYKIVLPSDLTATISSDPHTKERTLNLVRKTYGVVSNLEEVIETIQSNGRSTVGEE